MQVRSFQFYEKATHRPALTGNTSENGNISAEFRETGPNSFTSTANIQVSTGIRHYIRIETHNPMSALGQKQTFALAELNVRFSPKTDVRRVNANPAFLLFAPLAKCQRHIGTQSSIKS